MKLIIIIHSQLSITKMFHPLHRFVVRLREAPVSACGRSGECFRSCDFIVSGKCGCGRAGFVVVSERIEYGTFQTAREVHHIVILHGLFSTVGFGSLVEVLRPSAGTSVSESRQVAQGRVERRAECHFRIECSRDNGQCTALAASRHANVAAVPFGQRTQKVNAT